VTGTIFRTLLKIGLQDRARIENTLNGEITDLLSNGGKSIRVATANGKSVEYAFNGSPDVLAAQLERVLWFLDNYTTDQLQTFLNTYPGSVARATFI
jgi:hypothetical protein